MKNKSKLWVDWFRDSVRGCIELFIEGFMEDEVPVPQFLEMMTHLNRVWCVGKNIAITLDELSQGKTGREEE